MKRVLIGHRGAGKTHLLKRHLNFFPDIPHFDLDEEIAKEVQIPLTDYFKEAGEQQFRKIEHEIYRKIKLSNNSYVIALGAGFDPENIDSTDEVILVSRVTDADGRIFLDRPRLDINLDPIEESKNRFSLRNPNFFKRANKVYYMPEGVDGGNETEKAILTERYRIDDAYYTLTEPEIVNIESILKNYARIELRTDLVEPDRINELLSRFPKEDWLVSVRTENAKISSSVRIDWDINLSSLPEGLPPAIFSSHDAQIVTGIEKLKQFSTGQLKLCPMVESFEELRIGHEWQKADPQNRSFLPRSANGKWQWWRLLGKYSQKLNYIRNFTNLNDQPSTYEWLVLPNEKPKAWAAVIGKPIYFSRTPIEHETFFQKKTSFVSKIEMSEDEFKAQISWLNTVGLTYAAVTSPLKAFAYILTTEFSPIVQTFKAVNTMYFKESAVCGHNTDINGFQFLVKDFTQADQQATLVWGGGGTLQMMKAVLPGAHYVSSLTGKIRDNSTYIPSDIKYLIWAAPRTNEPQWPSDELNVKHVIDLNYTENSMGLEYALKINAKYTSGLIMFQQQAVRQQEFWSSQ